MPPKRKNWTGKVDEGSAAILRMGGRGFSGLIRETETGTEVVISTYPPMTYFSLTNLTLDELRGLRALWNLMIDEAEPLVAALDREARERYENGDDLDVRLYRQPPVFVVRERVLEEYREGLRSRLAGAAELQPVDGRLPDFMEFSGALGRGVPDGQPQGVEPEDDAPEDDGVPFVGEGER
jgi:hypothetical protein